MNTMRTITPFLDYVNMGRIMVYLKLLNQLSNICLVFNFLMIFCHFLLLFSPKRNFVLPRNIAFLFFFLFVCFKFSYYFACTRRNAQGKEPEGVFQIFPHIMWHWVRRIRTAVIVCDNLLPIFLIEVVPDF